MTDPLTAAREALAEYDAPRCGVEMSWIITGLRCNRSSGHQAWIIPGLQCNRSSGHHGRHEHMAEHDDDRIAGVTPDHLRAALARVDELTAEVERLRLAGITCTRGTECHITRGRDV